MSFALILFKSIMLIIRSDYATWTNLQDNITSNAMVCDYKMVSTFKGFVKDEFLTLDTD